MPSGDERSNTGGGRNTAIAAIDSNEKAIRYPGDNIPALVYAESVTLAAETSSSSSTPAATATAVSLDVPATTAVTAAATTTTIPTTSNLPMNHPTGEVLVVTFDDDVGGAADETTPLVISSSSTSASRRGQTGSHPTAPPPPPEQFGGDSAARIVSDQSEHSTISESGPVFRDWPFAVLFWLHLGVVVYIGCVYSTKGFQRMADDFDYDEIQAAIAAQDDVTPEDLEHFNQFVAEVYTYLQGYPIRIMLYTLIPMAIISLIYLDLTVGILLKYFGNFMVRSSLICSVVFPVVIMTLLFVSEPSVLAVLLAVIIVGSTSYFAWKTWSYIDFAAINIKMAIDGLNSNMGIYFWTLTLSKCSVLWVIVWLYVFLGVHFLQHIECEEREHPDESTMKQWEGHDDDGCHLSPWTLLGLLFSLYWTTNVIVAYVQVTVAGVTATWLYDKDAARGCCSSAVWGSLHRAGTYSFGSICLGSATQGFVGILRWFVKGAKNQQDSDRGETCCGALCSCIVECIAHIGGPILDYFSQWNYVYISIYGQDYLTSGKKVNELFRRKGWQSIITERLDSFCLGWVTFGIGILSGATALLVETIVSMIHSDREHESYVYGPLPSWRLVCFSIGMTIGVVASSVMMRVIKAGINTLIVCWADHPGQVELNHPKRAKELVDAWSKAFPQSFNHFDNSTVQTLTV